MDNNEKSYNNYNFLNNNYKYNNINKRNNISGNYNLTNNFKRRKYDINSLIEDDNKSNFDFHFSFNFPYDCFYPIRGFPELLSSPYDYIRIENFNNYNILNNWLNNLDELESKICNKYFF